MKKIFIALLFITSLVSVAYAGNDRVQVYNKQTGKTRILADGTSGQVIKTDGDGNVSWGTISSSGAENIWTDAGSTVQLTPSGTTDDVYIKNDLSVNKDLTVYGNIFLGNSTGDTVNLNTGTWFFTNDTNFSLTGGTNGLSFDGTTFSIDASGDKIGIGTSSPDKKLEIIDASAAQLRLTQADASVYADMQVDSNGDLIVNVDGVSNQLVLDNGGNVGIGTTGADRKLDILDASNPQLRLSQADATIYADFQVNSSGDFIINIDNIINQLVLKNNGNIEMSKSLSVSQDLSVDNGTFYVSSALNKVGINNITPSYNLDVSNGDIGVTNLAFVGFGSITGNVSLEDEVRDGFEDQLRLGGSLTISEVNPLSLENWTDSDKSLSTSGNAYIGSDLTVRGLLELHGGIDFANSTGTFSIDGSLTLLEDLTTNNLIVTDTDYKPYEENVCLTVTGATTTNVYYDALPIQGILTLSKDLTNTITTSGLNGLDSGDSEAAKRWYEIYVITTAKGVTGTLLNEYLTTSGATSITMPTGYLYKRRIGFVFNNGSSNLVRCSNSLLPRNYHQGADDLHVFDISSASPGTGDSPDQKITKDVSALIPPDANGVEVHITVRDDVVGSVVRPRNQNGGSFVPVISQAVNAWIESPSNCSIHSTGKLYYSATNTTFTNCSMVIRSWTIGKRVN